MADIMDYKCPKCGGSITFSAAKQKFVCEWCDSEYTEDELRQYSDRVTDDPMPEEKAAQAAGDAQADGGDIVNSYSCSSCGAQVVCDDSTSATSCPYCGSPMVFAGKLSGQFKPDCVVPFKLTKKDAQEALKKFCSGKALLPKVFTSQNTIEEMKGVYVPFWLCSCDTDSRIAYDARKVSTHSDDKNEYVETSFYDVARSGSLGFDDIPVDASDSMDDAYMEGLEPYDYGEMVDFNPAYLSGFLADRYDSSAEDSFKRAESRIDSSVRSAFANTVKGYDSYSEKEADISIKNKKSRYALMPVWLLTSKFADKNYLFAVNGQTGKVSGELPIDKGKLYAICGGVAAAIIAIAQIFILR